MFQFQLNKAIILLNLGKKDKLFEITNYFPMTKGLLSPPGAYKWFLKLL